VYVQAGEWFGIQGKMKPQPFSQAKTNAFALRDELKDRWPGVFDHFPVRYAVAFPNTTELRGHLPPDIKRSQLFLAPDLEDPQNAIDLLLAGARVGSRFTVEQMNGFACTVNEWKLYAHHKFVRLKDLMPIVASQLLVEQGRAKPGWHWLGLVERVLGATNEFSSRVLTSR
jgi:hypothetical protein